MRARALREPSRPRPSTAPTTSQIARSARPALARRRAMTNAPTVPWASSREQARAIVEVVRRGNRADPGLLRVPPPRASNDRRVFFRTMGPYRDPTLPFLVGQDCDIGTYSYMEDSSSCLLCASPLTTTAANTAYCDGCVAGYYWSEDQHTTFLQSNSHEDGFQCTDCCKQCDKGMACDEPGLTVETLVIKEGYWRGSLQSVKVEPCERRHNCPGSKSESLGGDDLCDDHSKGMICNACEGGYYLGETGECLTCSSRIKTLVAVVAGFVAVVVIATLLRPCVSRVPWRKKNWWLTTFFTLWYTARARRAPSPFKTCLSENKRGPLAGPINRHLLTPADPHAAVAVQIRAQGPRSGDPRMAEEHRVHALRLVPLLHKDRRGHGRSHRRLPSVLGRGRGTRVCYWRGEPT